MGACVNSKQKPLKKPEKHKKGGGGYHGGHGGYDHDDGGYDHD